MNNQNLENQANYDFLTQVANRRFFHERLQAEWQRLTKEKQPLTLILLDIDQFKYYYDTYGPYQSDDCILKIAQALQKLIGSSADLVARYGNDEFAILLPNTTLEEGIKIAQNIQQAIYDLAIPHPQSKVKEIFTVSLGISSLIPSLEIQPDILIGNADKALYKAKEQGRDRLSINP